MAESIVSSAVQLIGSLLIQEGTALLQVEDQVQSLQRELVFIKGYLQDADSKQQQTEIGDLITQIRKLAYDAEDIIETYILKVEARVQHNGTWTKRWLLRSACFLYNSPNIYEVVKDIQAIQSCIKQVTGNFITYGVRKGSEVGIGGGLSPSRDEKYWRQMRVRQSYSYDDDDDHVVGWEKDTAELVQVLVDEGKSQISFLSIVGMGGSGKTTLARKLYNNPQVKKCFNCKAWVFISQEWSTRDILSLIFKKAGGSKDLLQATVPELVEELRNMLEKKSYLVVLDDVWRREALEEILPALPRGYINKGSKVVITTRNQEIIQFVGQHNQHIYKPPPLADEEAWELFSKIALDSRSNNYRIESFKHLAKEMLKKCNGLPLAIVALSGILRTKGSISEWQQVNEAVRLRVMEGTATHKYGRVGDLLALSYDDLPYYLKPCFLYLGVFPEDCQIPTGMLTRMWIAEGLATDTEGIGLSPEDVAIRQLEELSHRFLVQIARTNVKGEIKTIRLHDLLRDLSVKKAKEQSFLEIYTPANCPLSSNVPQFSIEPRRAALHSSVTLPTQISHLRSLVMLTKSSVVHSAYASKETLRMEVIYKNFKLLRLLNLWGTKTSNGTLPVQIGSLVHLRYLGIRTSSIRELPVSIGNLRNLLTLDYRDVDLDDGHLIPIKITNALGKLVRMRHLFLPVECPWKEEEFSLRTMKNLRTLWGVKQVGDSSWLSKEVGNLITTLKKLKIMVTTERELRNIFGYVSISSNGLHTFHCEIKYGVALQQVEPICKHQLLHKLTLIGEVRVKLAHILPSNLVILDLKHSKLVEDPVPAIGAMQHLKLLKLSNCYLGTIFACISGSFPQLEELYLGNLDNLKDWYIEKGSMLCLRKLEILHCKKLHCLPKGFSYVITLQELEYFGMPKEFDRHASELGWSPRSRLPHNYEAILDHCDSPVNTYSVGKLIEQLTAGVFLHDKNEKYWVIKEEDDYYNCFMLYANHLFPLSLDCKSSWVQSNPMELYYSCCELIKVGERYEQLV